MFDTPTTPAIPRSRAAAPAPYDATVSTSEAYTPPWTIPYGWWCWGPMTTRARTRSGVHS